MFLVQVIKDTTMLVSGYEHHTWQCSGCSTVERRMTFNREKTPTQTAPFELGQPMLVQPTEQVLGQLTQAIPAESLHINECNYAYAVLWSDVLQQATASNLVNLKP